MGRRPWRGPTIPQGVVCTRTPPVELWDLPVFASIGAYRQNLGLYILRLLCLHFPSADSYQVFNYC